MRERRLKQGKYARKKVGHTWDTHGGKVELYIYTSRPHSHGEVSYRNNRGTGEG